MTRNKISIFTILALLIFIPIFSVFAEESNPEVVPVIIPEAQVPEEETVIEEPIPQNAILIRNGDTIVHNDNIDLPSEGTIEILDSNGVSHQVNTRSVLGVLYALDQANDSFSLSNLQYYDSFSSFYVKCITLADVGELCDSWQYVVGGASPGTSVDSTMLSGGENIALYFGNPYKVELSSVSITTSESITATAQSYNYTDNTWSVRTGVTIGVTTPNPDDPWNPTIVASYPVDTNGQAVLSFTDAGSYTVGISEDYYFPSYTISINPVSEGGGGGFISTPTFSITNALSFLESKQNTDGSFNGQLYTDWVAIAIASSGSQANDMRVSITDYLKNNKSISSIVTDNERHAMALMSLGINPYSGTNVDYISKIVSSFDGTQIGDDSLINDDIFGLIVLKNVGYRSNDEIINKGVALVLSEQSSDGSWGSIDMTAAGIQALRNFTDISLVSESIEKAENYLISNQSNDGGFGDSFATSWALQALSQNPSFGLQIAKADSYLATKQQIDGGLDRDTDLIDNRVWSTSYAIPGVLHLSWNDIMSSFDKEETNTESVAHTVIDDSKSNPTEIIEVLEKKIIEEEQTEEVLLKIEKPKVKTNIAKKNITEKPLIILEENIDTPNGIVAGASINRSKLSMFVDSILSTILAPFTWLLVRLGF